MIGVAHYMGRLNIGQPSFMKHLIRVRIDTMIMLGVFSQLQQFSLLELIMIRPMLIIKVRIVQITVLGKWAYWLPVKWVEKKWNWKRKDIFYFLVNSYNDQLRMDCWFIAKISNDSKFLDVSSNNCKQPFFSISSTWILNFFNFNLFDK